MTDAIEWTWTLLNAGGVVFLILVLSQIRRDEAAASLPELTNGRRGMWIGMVARPTWFFLAEQLLAVGVGAFAIVTPNRPETTAGDIAGAVFIARAAWMDWITWSNLRARQRIRTYKPR